jgi:hypothetical protein
VPFLHLHRGYEEAFYVLEGEVVFQLGASEVGASAVGAVLVPQACRTAFETWGRATRTGGGDDSGPRRHDD